MCDTIPTDSIDRELELLVLLDTLPPLAREIFGPALHETLFACGHGGQCAIDIAIFTAMLASKWDVDGDDLMQLWHRHMDELATWPWTVEQFTAIVRERIVL